MKNHLIPLALGTILLASCESKAGTGALVGAGGGALIGGVAGGGTGALIGAGAGAVGGAIIGYTLDEHDRAVMESRSPQTMRKIDNGEQLSIQDVKNMSRNGLKDETIINQMKATNSTYTLTADQIIDLKKSGVSQKVIDYMIQTRS